MGDTKEKILRVALRLFAQNGYEAVSVSDIAGELGMTKGALYRHYKNKRDIFDHIVARMAELDGVRASQYQLPEGTLEEMEEAYKAATMEKLMDFTLAQFQYWTEEEFPSNFRKMLTIEQYRGEEMGDLYQGYLGAGPLHYVEDLFRAWHLEDPWGKAVEFYGPMFLLYAVVDGLGEAKKARETLRQGMILFLKECSQGKA